MHHDRSAHVLIDVVGIAKKTCESFVRRIGSDIRRGVEFDVDWLIVKPSEPGLSSGHRTAWGTTVTVGDTVRIREVKAA